MYKSKQILAVVPARGGSKGVPLKNIYPLNGMPLIAYTGKLTQNLPLLDRVVASTDHEGIASAAKESGIAAPFRRPADLSGDRIGDWDVLVHALKEMESLDGKTYDVVVMLQPTCPLRTAAHVADTITKLIDEEFDSVWTVSPIDVKNHPYKQLAIDAMGRMSLFHPQGTKIIARQQLQTTYIRNGAAYAITRNCLLEQKTILGEKSGAIIVSDTLVNIDEIADFEKLEEYFRKQKSQSAASA